MQLHRSTVSGYPDTTGVTANRIGGQSMNFDYMWLQDKLKQCMAFVSVGFILKKWFEDYNIEFGNYGGMLLE